MKHKNHKRKNMKNHAVTSDNAKFCIHLNLLWQCAKKGKTLQQIATATNRWEFLCLISVFFHATNTMKQWKTAYLNNMLSVLPKL